VREDDIRLTPISNGTVIDHLPPNTALRILEILDLTKHNKATTAAINTESSRMGRKDLIFIEGKELSDEEVNKIALIAHGATLNTIKNREVSKKMKIPLPDKAVGILQCLNPNCITNKEKIDTKFSISQEGRRATCFYCERTMNEEEIKKAVR
jgi:aspartate carbamoyltransferase regulatory subunit